MNASSANTQLPAMTTPRFPVHPIESLAGTSFKHEHLSAIIADGPVRGFFEVHAEIYMGAGARLTMLSRRSGETILCLCTASACPSGRRRRWSTHETTYFSDLLPLPYTESTLKRVCEHIDEVQETIRRPILIENPSTYVAFQELTLSERDFIRSIADRTGCGLLLDVNNVFVSATNHGFSALEYLADFPLSRVGEIHLAGHAEQADDEGDLLLIDSHDGPVADAVWKLFTIVIARRGPIPTLIEWDSKIPDWAVLKAEAAAAQAILDKHRSFAERGQSDAA